MAQESTFACPRCGAPATADQRVCARCGLRAEDIERGAGFQPAPQSPTPFPDAPTEMQQVRQSPAPFPAQPQTPPPAAPFRPPQRGNRVLVLLLALVVIVGVVAYVAAGLLGAHLPGFGPGAQGSVSTTTLNTKIIYASVEITILNVQQSQSFVDDPHATSNGMLRLHLQEHNPTSQAVRYNYYDSAHLLIPGQAAAAPVYVKATTGVAPNATQSALLDFTVPQSVKVGQLTLRLGTSSEAQMDIPLSSGANVARYQPKTVSLNGQMTYFGLNWTLTSATAQWSVGGQQATKGMKYVTVTLKVDNTLAQTAITGSPYEYIRLKAGNTTASPVDTTLPTSFAQGASGKTGTVTFLVPQESTAFTLMLVPQKNSGDDQATSSFQIG